MDKIVGILGGVSPSSLKSKNDDDAADRLSYRYSAGLFILFAAVVSTKQYVGDPISCFVNAMHDLPDDYVNNLCWVKNNYHLIFEQADENGDMQKLDTPIKGDIVRYYQWVPLMLLFQAFLFCCPRVIWRALNKVAAVDIDSVVDQAKDYQKADAKDEKDTPMNYMIKMMDRFCMSRTYYKKNMNSGFADRCPAFTQCGRFSGNYLTLTYLFAKLLYIGNILGQFFAMNLFLGHDFLSFGLEVMHDIKESTFEWRDSPRFPRVTYCVVNVMNLHIQGGSVTPFQAQCVLPINVFNEMIYLFMWCWMIFMIVVTSANLLKWLGRTFIPGDKRHFIKRFLFLKDKIIDEDDNQKVDNFIDSYLKWDGVFILRIVALYVDVVTVTELTCALWDKWIDRKDKNIEEKQSYKRQPSYNDYMGSNPYPSIPLKSVQCH